MTKENKVHVLILSDEDKDRLTKIGGKVIDLIDETKNVQEKAFILRMLIESFEDNYKCVIPFKNRYTEPTHIYQNRGS